MIKKLLLCLMAADYLTGLIAAVIGKRRKSGKTIGMAGFQRLLHKAVMLLVLLLAAVLDWFIHDQNAMFFTAVCWMYIGSEALSLLENLRLCGVPVPARLRRRLETFSGVEEAPVQVPSGPQPESLTPAR